MASDASNTGAPSRASVSTGSTATKAAPISQFALDHLLNSIEIHTTRLGHAEATARLLATRGELEIGLANVAHGIADTLEELIAYLDRAAQGVSR